MKIKFSWVLFAPFLALALGLKIYQSLFFTNGGSFLGMNNSQLNYFTVILIAVLFLLIALLAKLDKQTSDAYELKRNVPAGLLSIICAAAIAASVCVDFTEMLTADYAVLWLISDILGLLAAIALIISADALFKGKNGAQGMALLYVVPSIWAASRLVAVFSGFTALSVRAEDMSSIVAYVFLTMFLFYQAEAIVSLKDKGAIKKLFVFGLPAIAMLVLCGTGTVITLAAGKTEAPLSLLPSAVEFWVFALYIASYLIAMTSRLITNDEVEQMISEQENIGDDLPEEEYRKYDDMTEQLEAEETEGEFTVSQASADADSKPEKTEEKPVNNDDFSDFENAKRLLNNLLDEFD